MKEVTMHCQWIGFLVYCCIYVALTADTDIDAGECDKNWKYFLKTCYKFGDIHINWSDAERACRTDGSLLVEITSEEEDRFLRGEIIRLGRRRRRHIKRGYEPNYWIGGTDQDNEGRWIWQAANKEITGYKNFADGQPNDENGNEDCLEMNMQLNGKWNDASCNSRQMYICERPSKSAVLGSAVG